ncbi:MAG: glycoside hydrolase family 18 protein [Acidobacteriaceae bacterium]|nr:glycoside hydrolase family 18 protein [Acidobacteriaceae bacterium]MBV9309132.1 glycoside hydrolase family 18 protein [Acidobacteriaceae bacterium]MBV9675949.1 glycoside hydrolase family 18 protein [Acidobacteriaceae bacterium]MBV9939153.1 glycoside hydrolase family 18 protein [Acidobacteriaceae bacterium]
MLDSIRRVLSWGILKRSASFWLGVTTLLLVVVAFFTVGFRGVNERKIGWVTGYWYSPSVWGGLPVKDIEFSALTHVIHCGPTPNADGTFEEKSLQYVRDYAGELVRTAHRHNVKVLLCMGQFRAANTYTCAARPEHLGTFVSNIIELMDAYGYDGVDLDWESGVDPQQFMNLVGALRSRLNARNPRGLLTGAFWESTWYLAKVQNDFDQINVMTYDECSPGDGFSWHNAALYRGPHLRRRSVDWRIRQFTSSIPAAKLGLGLPFYGYLWEGGAGTPTGGVTGPGQEWKSAPTMRLCNFRDLISNPLLWQAAYKRRDQSAGNVPYLSVDRPGSAKDSFVTYDDEISLAEKVRYAKNNRLGGLMIWELSADYMPHGAIKHPLLKSVKDAAR